MNGTARDFLWLFPVKFIAVGLVVVVPTAEAIVVTCKEFGSVRAFNVTITKPNVVSALMSSGCGFYNIWTW